MTENAWWRNPAGSPAWEGTTTPVPATGPAPARDLPEGVVRTRRELEQLRDDALARQGRHPLEAGAIWCSPDGVPSALEAVIDTTRWLLGERPYAPFTGEVSRYPELAVSQVWLDAEDCIFGHGWPDVSEWYAGGVKRVIDWARSGEEPRPLFPNE
ncbi:hypothetical protein [Streptomyces achromogenes]|uniref:hypothetical protein n=1 Tax=Streptomyces achromogenes TaxID=67255 RepID=UPI00343CE8FB